MGEGGPLRGRRVVDFSLYLPGPLASRALTDLGAEVIKVEPPKGDPVSDLMPGVYEFVNRGKRAVRLDLKQEEGRELALALAATADAVLEAFRPGTASRLGVGFEAVRERNPRVVYGSISSFGQFGPDRDRPGHNIGYEAAGGSWAATLAAGEAPHQNPLAAADVSGGLLAALTVCAHLSDPEREAVHLDVSLGEALGFVAAPRWGTFLAEGDTSPDPTSFPNYAPGNALYETADGRHLALAAVEDKFWQALCGWLERPDLAAPPYDDHHGRMLHRGELGAALADAFRRLPLEEIVAAGNRHDFPAEPVRGFEGILGNPHLAERRALRTLDGGGVVPDFPVLSDECRSFSSDRQPDLADDERWLLEELGVDSDSEARLRDLGVLQQTRREA